MGETIKAIPKVHGDTGNCKDMVQRYMEFLKEAYCVQEPTAFNEV